MSIHVRRISLVWIVPLVAAIGAGWLAYRSLAERGPVVNITFERAGGVEAGRTKIKHNDIELGTVTAVAPTPDLKKVIVTAEMTRAAASYLAASTRFWVVSPRFSLEGISGLGTLLSGSYIEMDPGSGQSSNSFVGLRRPPVVPGDEEGRSFLLKTPRLGSVSQGSPIYYHGIRVGRVMRFDLSDQTGDTTIRIFIDAPHDKLVHEGTRFWSVSGLDVSIGSEGLKLHAEAVESLLAGGIAFDVPPEGVAGSYIEADHSFILYANADAAQAALFSRSVRFLVQFPGSVDGLSVDAPVRMRGIQVGKVASIRMQYDYRTDRFAVPVVIEIQPDRVTLLNEPTGTEPFEQHAYASFSRFVARGLRARLVSGSLITGQKLVSLDFVEDAKPAKLVNDGSLPEIPALESGGLDAVLLEAKNLLVKLQSTVTGVNGILSSPELRRSVTSLQHTLANLDRITRDASVQTGPLLADLQATANAADVAFRKASVLVETANSALGNQSERDGDLAGTLRELKNTARSARTLVDYLENHPESLVQGKGAAAR